MRVLHIIPSAFDYFEDIRDSAMTLAHNERERGLDVEAITLQYGAVGQSEKAAIRKISPVMSFAGLISGDSIIKLVDDFDIIHLHLPTLGLMRRIIEWKKKNINKPLIITYWRDPKINDIFSYFISLYNRYYEKQLRCLADKIVCFLPDDYQKIGFLRRLADKNKIINIDKAVRNIALDGIHLTNIPNDIKLTKADMEALACISIYDKLINNSNYGEQRTEELF